MCFVLFLFAVEFAVVSYFVSILLLYIVLFWIVSASREVPTSKSNLNAATRFRPFAPQSQSYSRFEKARNAF